MGAMEGLARRTVGARTGGRSERVVRDVLRATVDELAKAGFGALRVEDVAARAGVNKTTVYRRWPTKTDLVAAAIRACAGHHQPLPDSGSARHDLVQMLERAIGFARTAEGRAITRLVTVESGDPDVDRICRSLRDGMLEQRSIIIERAKARGELPHDVDARLLLDAIFVPVMTRVLRFHEEVDTKTAEAFVDLVLAGAKHL
jgi:AcrR family transcriptional regulator